MANIDDKTYSVDEHQPKTVAELLYRMESLLEQAIIAGGYNPRGEYSQDVTYSKNDAVVWNSSGYVHYSDTSTSGITPDDDSIWRIFVSGVIGPQGPKGEQGIQGPQGLQGPQGPQGLKGDTGARGPQGSQGEKGEDGAQGPQGLTGAQGARGPEGPQGIQGIQGPQGLTGEIGPQGPQGVQGPKGDKGDKGDNGTGLTIISTLATAADLEPLKATAKAGDAYAVGTAIPRDIYMFSDNIKDFVNQGPIQGPQGPEGPQGPQGVQGLTGATGPQGTQGPQGLQGKTGPQGPQGDTGPQGPAGKDGAPGATGPQGPQGVQGLTGATGPQGTQGPQGLQGKTGPQGPQGDTGPQGPAGKDGAPGATGPQGPAGPLPNYVSFETPTSINVSTNGNEVTYTGVAEFEADGSMESGEYHQVLPMPVEMLIPAPVTDPPVVGGTINLGSAYFNRQPLINEYFLLRALSPTKNILTLAIAKCKEKSGANAVCEIVNKNDISVSPKKYAHNITIESGNAVIGFTIFTSHPNAYSTALSVHAAMGLMGLSANQQIPASGVVGNNLPVYCIRRGVNGLVAIAVGMSDTLDSETEAKDIVVPL